MKAIKLLQLSSLFLILNGCGGGSTSPTNTTTPDTSTPPTNPVVEVDNTPPEITLNGDDEITITQGRDFNDPGVTAFDTNDGDLTISVVGSVDNRTLGEYTLTYTAKDNAGNTSSVSRTIVVEAIEFNDAGLTFCIKRELHYTHDVFLNIEELPKLEQLEIIENLHCDLLKFANRIEDFSVLPSLKNLKQITLDGTGYTIIGSSSFGMPDPADGEDLTIDLTPFAELKHLESLTIHHLGIENIDRISNLVELTIESPNGSTITDIDFSHFTQLKKLNINDANIVNASNLEQLTSLESLNIISNNLIDTSAINKLVNLKELFLSGEKLNPDFIPLSQLTQLEFLSLENSNLSNIDFLMNIPSSLTKLSIARNSIEEITGLSNLIQLKELNISRNNISDISKLQNLTQLRELDISWNFISEIDDLVYLSELRELNLHQNCIVGFYVLTQLRYVHFLTMNTAQRTEGCSY